MEKIQKALIFILAGLALLLLCVAGAYITVKTSNLSELNNNNQTNISSEMDSDSEIPMVVAFSPFVVADAPKICQKGYKLDNSGTLCRKKIWHVIKHATKLYVSRTFGFNSFEN